jgi:hypothetical protein
LIIGAGRLERVVAAALLDAEVPVLLATTNRRDEYRARMAGVPTHYGNVLVEDVDLELDLSGIGRILALTPNDDVNTLAVTRFVGLFGRAETYQLAPGRVPAGVDSSAATHLAGRLLFDQDANYEKLSSLVRAGATIGRTSITPEFTVDHFRAANPEAIPLFVLKPNRRLQIITTAGDDPWRNVGENDTILALME